jgi:hypothetical protein
MFELLVHMREIYDTALFLERASVVLHSLERAKRLVAPL